MPETRATHASKRDDSGGHLLKRTELARLASENLRHVEGLREEALDLARTRDCNRGCVRGFVDVYASCAYVCERPLEYNSGEFG